MIGFDKDNIFAGREHYVLEVLKDYRKTYVPEGFFVDSLILQELTKKNNHYDVLRDIRKVIRDLVNNDKLVGELGFDPQNVEGDLTEVIREYETNKNQRELNFAGVNTSLGYANDEKLTKENQCELNFGGDDKQQHFKAVLYKDRKGEERYKFYLSERAYIMMMGYYSDYITLQLYRFYKMVKDFSTLTPMEMLSAPEIVLTDGLEIANLTILLQRLTDTEGGEVTDLYKNTRSQLSKAIKEYEKNRNEINEIDVIKSSVSTRPMVDKKDKGIYANVDDIVVITGKRPANILRDIDDIIANVRKVDPNEAMECFIKTTKKTSQNKDVKTYEMTEEGYVLLMCHYYVSYIWDLAGFYVNTKHTVIPSVYGLINSNISALIDASNIFNRNKEYDFILDSVQGRYPSKSESYVENKRKEIIEEKNQELSNLTSKFVNQYGNENK